VTVSPNLRRQTDSVELYPARGDEREKEREGGKEERTRVRDESSR